MRVYADETFYTDYLGTPPAHLPRLLAAASVVVESATVGLVYATDAAGLPTDPDVVEVFAKAACLIAADMDATGALAAGSTQRWDSVSIGSVSLSGPSETQTAQAAGVAVPAEAALLLSSLGKPTVAVVS